MSILEIVKDNFRSGTVQILLLYRIPNSSLSMFYNRPETFLSTHKMFDIILGDFNISVVANKNNLQQVMSQYQLINHEPTHISGSLLNHVYVKICKEAIQAVSVYFSAHQPVKFELRLLSETRHFLI